MPDVDADTYDLVRRTYFALPNGHPLEGELNTWLYKHSPRDLNSLSTDGPGPGDERSECPAHHGACIFCSLCNTCMIGGVSSRCWAATDGKHIRRDAGAPADNPPACDDGSVK